MENFDHSEMEFLDKQDTVTLAKWWCKLNSWEWPDGLPNKQASLHTFERGELEKWRGGLIMDYIEMKIGKKRCNREWNRESMSDTEHETFWAAHYLGDGDALKRDTMRRRRLVLGDVREA